MCKLLHARNRARSAVWVDSSSLAVHVGHQEATKLLLQNSSTPAYLQDNQGMSALHIVAKQGHVNVMEEIISHNPDACELIDNRGWNPLHVAIANAKLNVVRLILKKLRLDSLINATNRKFMIVKKLDKQGGRASLRSLVNGINIHEVGHENNEIKCHRLKNISNIHLLVASLIATVTFTTGFTMPGGYEQDRSSTKGMAMFCNKTSFKVFVIAYSKAFYCSSA
ncbi:hypothetical protein FEM48_Zijuj04G0198200 [Ziziphus jujuba var. spinosa]|uniref:PGG domain-containing protein n=1 Tax=Ziziphus jujuba var. spinosa TaxID=714518 RepID=A0A978VLU9_ZIZJJ|nr:hypothetical protein FEM48_Zijuj04G0198200 [Ziziphus jujuba var. spinosa]